MNLRYLLLLPLLFGCHREAPKPQADVYVDANVKVSWSTNLEAHEAFESVMQDYWMEVHSDSTITNVGWSNNVITLFTKDWTLQKIPPYPHMAHRDPPDGSSNRPYATVKEALASPIFDTPTNRNRIVSVRGSTNLALDVLQASWDSISTTSNTMTVLIADFGTNKVTLKKDWTSEDFARGGPMTLINCIASASNEFGFMGFADSDLEGTQMVRNATIYGAEPVLVFVYSDGSYDYGEPRFIDYIALVPPGYNLMAVTIPATHATSGKETTIWSLAKNYVIDNRQKAGPWEAKDHSFYDTEGDYYGNWIKWGNYAVETNQRRRMIWKWVFAAFAILTAASLCYAAEATCKEKATDE